MAKAGRGADQYMLRLPPGLRDRIKAVAESKGTSINSEIISVLEVVFPEPFSVSELVDDTKALVEELREHGSLQSLIELQEVLSDAAEVLVQIRRPREQERREMLRERLGEVSAGLRKLSNEDPT